MALSQAPQLQWSLDQTTGGILSISKSLIQAATSDNVQTLALLTCESFGSTLPVSTVTRLKIEKLARQNRMYALEFLKAQVGYRAGDAADALSRSDGGVRFLCLAAILVSWDTDPLRSAQLLELQIKQNASKNQPMPTLLQLRDLLVALKPKLLRCNFIEDFLGWQQLCASDDGGHNYLQDSPVSPSYVKFSALLDALRRCFRVGGDNEIVRIQSWNHYVPWTIAVIKWMTGNPPTLEYGHGYRQSRDFELVADSRVSVTGVEDFGRFSVVISQRIESFETIISPDNSRDADRYSAWVTGFVAPQTWFKSRILALRVKPEIALPVLHEALVRIPEVVLLSDRVVQPAVKIRAAGLQIDLPHPFPDTSTRLAFLKLISAQISGVGQDCTWTQDLSTQCANECSRFCGCTPLQQTDQEGFAMGYATNMQWPGSVDSPSTLCLRQRLGQMIADVLTLVLFYSGTNSELLPRLQFPDFRSNAFGGWSKSGHVTIDGKTASSDGWLSLIIRSWWQILSGDLEVVSCQPRSLFQHIARLAGCPSGMSDLSFVSSFGGQVIYPALVETRQPQRLGYFQMICRPGILLHEGIVVSHILDRKRSHFDQASSGRFSPELRACKMRCLKEFRDDTNLTATFQPRPMAADERIKIWLHWDPSVSSLEGAIEHSMLSQHPKSSHVWDLIHGIAQTLFVPAYWHTGAITSHDSADLDNILIVMDGLLDKKRLDEHPGNPFLVPLENQPGTQLAQMSVIKTCVIQHTGGCIICTLRLALSLDVRVVIS